MVIPLPNSLISKFIISGKKFIIISNANGPPNKIPIVPVRNIIIALGPNFKISFKSTLRVNKTKEQGRRYLDATKYKFELLESIIPVELKKEGKK